MRTLFAFAVLSVALLPAASFSTLPADGNRSGVAGDVVGWGYSIENDSNLWLVPMGLSSSGVLFGSLTDVYDYGVVAPLSSASLAFLFTAPGGPGFSVGLFEYLMPLAAPAGLVQNGTFTLQYQFFSDNPDVNPLAVPVGAILAFPEQAFVITVTDSSVPEPDSWMLFLLGVAGLFVARARWLVTGRE